VGPDRVAQDRVRYAAEPCRLGDRLARQGPGDDFARDPAANYQVLKVLDGHSCGESRYVRSSFVFAAHADEIELEWHITHFDSLARV
jgi:hypothetical protein